MLPAILGAWTEEQSSIPRSAADTAHVARGRPNVASAHGRELRSSRGSVVGLEIAPLSIELMGDVEREAALEAIAELYDSIGRPFQVLSVRAERDPGDHLAAMAERAEGRRMEKALAAYAALYRELAAAQRRLRRTYLLLDAPSEPERRRAMDAVLRTAEDRGVGVREVGADELASLWDALARAGQDHRVGPSMISGEGVATALVPSRRWPAQVEPGWLSALLAMDGVDAVSMRVRPLGRAEAMSVHDDPSAPGPRGRPAGLRAGRARRRRARARRCDRARAADGRSTPGRAGSTSSTRCSWWGPRTAPPSPSGSRTCCAGGEGPRPRARGRDVPARRRLAVVLPGPAPRPLAERNLDSARASPRACSMSRATCTSPRATCTGAPARPARRSCSTGSRTPATTRSFSGRPAPARRWSRAPRSIRCLIQGIRVLAVDPLGDYRRLTAELGGTYLDLGSPGVAINPFALHRSRDRRRPRGQDRGSSSRSSRPWSAA